MSFLYPLSFGTDKKFTLGSYSSLQEELETKLLLSLVSKGPYFRSETSKLSVTVGKDLWRSVFADE